MMRLAAAALLLFAWAAWGQPPQFPRQADLGLWMRDRLVEKLPGARVDYDAPERIRVTVPGAQELEVRTARVWDLCVSAPDRCAALAQDYVDNLVAASKEQSAPLTRERLRVVLRTDEYARDARHSFARAPAGRAPVMRPVARGLWLVLVGDLPTSMQLVAPDDLSPLNLTADEAIELGRRNLQRELPSLAANARRDPGGFYVLEGDDYESSRVLLSEAWAPLAKEWRQALAIMVPGSRVVLYAPSSDRAAVEAMEREGALRYRRSERRISIDMYHWTRSGWTRFRLPRSSDTASAESPPSEIRLLAILRETMLALRDDYVDPVDLGRLAAGCEPRLGAWLAKAAPSAARPGYEPADAGFGSAEELATPLYACIDGLAQTLDDGIELRRGAGYRELVMSGVGWAATGIVLERGEQHPRVRALVRPGPAADAGVRAGDELLRVGGVATRAMALPDVGELLRGLPGSSVQVTLRRAGSELELVVPREVFGERQSSIAALKSDGVLVAKPSMLHGSGLAFAEALVAARPKGVILDLRAHQGGLLEEAVAVAAAFLPPADVVVRMHDRRGEKVLRADRGDYWRTVEDVQRASALLKEVPLVVLVDAQTAAGAEMIAAALQANKRARVVGRTTRGAGTVGTIRPVGTFGSRHLLKIPTSRMLTPDGRRIEGQGVVPDVRIEGEDDDRDLQAAERLLAGGK